MTEWEPATEAEADMRDALRANDQELYFRILARTDLLLPISAQALTGRAPLGWGTWTTGGRTHVLAFTSGTALKACLAENAGSTRVTAYTDLAGSWPNHEWWLAVNPGLPIEGYLPAWFVAQLARGDVRLPGRIPTSARSRPEQTDLGPPSRGTAVVPGQVSAAAASAAAASGASASRASASAEAGAGGERDRLSQVAAGATGTQPATAPTGALSSQTAEHVISGWVTTPARSDSDSAAADYAAPDNAAADYAAADYAAPDNAAADYAAPGYTAPGYAGTDRAISGEVISGEIVSGTGTSASAAAAGAGTPSRDEWMSPDNPAPAQRPSQDPPQHSSLSAWYAATVGASADQPKSPEDRPVDSGQSFSGNVADAVPTEPMESVPVIPAPIRSVPVTPGPILSDPAASAVHDPDPIRDLPPTRDPDPTRDLNRAPDLPPAHNPAPDLQPAQDLPRAHDPAQDLPPVREPAPTRSVFDPVPPPVTPLAEFEPANEVERSLLEAAGDGSTETFLSTLLLAKVLLPVSPDSLPGARPGDEGFVWGIDDIDGSTHIVVYTSPERLADHLAAPVDTVGVKFVQLIRKWPQNDWSFAVNPGTPVGAKLPGAQIVGLASWAVEVGLGTEPEPVEPAQAPETGQTASRSTYAPSQEDPGRPTMMQKTIAPSQVGYYLERGYDRVSGFVNRATEVVHLKTPAQLEAALGLDYPGSLFTRDAEEIYVIRWPAYRPSLYRIPYGGQNEAAMRAMEGWVIERAPFRGNGFAPGEGSDVVAEFKVDSVRLPHGAQLCRVGADGTEQVIAVLDSDAPSWRRLGVTDA